MKVCIIQCICCANWNIFATTSWVKCINGSIVANYIPPRTYPEQWNIEGFKRESFRIYGINLAIEDWANHDKIDDEQVLLYLSDEVKKLFDYKIEHYSEHVFQAMARRCLLAIIDQLWKDHLYTLDHLRHSIGLRAYGQKDPLNEYKREAFHLFEAMMEHIKELFIQRLAHLEVRLVKNEEGSFLVDLYAPHQQSKTFETRTDPALINEAADKEASSPFRAYVDPSMRNANDPSSWGKIGRNEACPCGSGIKHKQCHGKI